MIDKESHSHEITIRKTISDLLHLGRNRLRGLISISNRVNQIFHRHRGNKFIARKCLLVTINIAIHNRINAAIRCLINSHDFSILDDMRTELLIMSSDGFPKLTRPILFVFT